MMSLRELSINYWGDCLAFGTEKDVDLPIRVKLHGPIIKALPSACRLFLSIFLAEQLLWLIVEIRKQPWTVKKLGTFKFPGGEPIVLPPTLQRSAVCGIRLLSAEWVRVYHAILAHQNIVKVHKFRIRAFWKAHNVRIRKQANQDVFSAGIPQSATRRRMLVLAAPQVLRLQPHPRKCMTHLTTSHLALTHSHDRISAIRTPSHPTRALPEASCGWQTFSPADVRRKLIS